MNRIFKTAGVTLLEIMLVLAVAAMIIVMSIRYFHSSQTTQKANDTMAQIQAIAAGMDNIAQGGAGSYTGITTSTLASVIGSNNMTTVTGAAATINVLSGTSYKVDMDIGPQVCDQVYAKLATNPNISRTPCSGGTLEYTYDSTQ